jgi:hypothetical protein
MEIDSTEFGSITINGATCSHDILIRSTRSDLLTFLQRNRAL